MAASRFISISASPIALRVLVPGTSYTLRAPITRHLCGPHATSGRASYCADIPLVIASCCALYWSSRQEYRYAMPARRICQPVSALRGRSLLVCPSLRARLSGALHVTHSVATAGLETRFWRAVFFAQCFLVLCFAPLSSHRVHPLPLIPAPTLSIQTLTVHSFLSQPP